VIFAVNRSLDEDMELTLDLEGFGDVTMLEYVELYSDDLLAVNTKDSQPIFPKNCTVPQGKFQQLQVNLKKHSWNMLRFSY